MNKLYDESSIQATANAIRHRGGTSALLKVEDFADAIEAIPSPEGERTVTENGRYDIEDYKYVDVNIPTTGSAVIDSLTVTSNGTYTAPSDVDGYSPVSVNVPQGYLLKISRTFDVDTQAYTFTLTHNLGTTNYYFDCYIDEDQEGQTGEHQYIMSASSTSKSNWTSLRTILTTGVVQGANGELFPTENNIRIGSSSWFIAGHTYTFYFYAKEDNANLPTVHLQNKTVNDNGTVTPDSSYSGLSSVSVNVPQGYLCKISRTFDEDTLANGFTITHNLGTLDYYIDCYIDALPTDSETIVLNSILSFSNTMDPDDKLFTKYIKPDHTYVSGSWPAQQLENTFKLSAGSAYYKAGHTYTFYFYAKNDTTGLPTLNLQNKAATENGIVTPDSGYSGLSSVTVNVPTVNLPTNMKVGVVDLTEESLEITFNHGLGVAPTWVELISEDTGDIISGSVEFNTTFGVQDIPISNELSTRIVYKDSAGTYHSSTGVTVTANATTCTITKSSAPGFRAKKWLWTAIARTPQ